MSTELTPLGRLIAGAQQDRQWSNRALERRAEELGLPGFTKTNIGKMKNEPPRHISTATLKNLAILIQVPERVVVEAAIRSTNLEYPERNTTGAAEAIENDVEISARDKRILLAAITAMKEAGDGDGKATPHTDAGGTPVTGADDGLGAFGGRARGDLDHESINDGAGDNVRPLKSSGIDTRSPSTGSKQSRRRASDGKFESIKTTQSKADDTSIDEIMKHAAYRPSNDEDES